ncbi:MAG: murein transglycosylase, partial [Enterobacteriaceae bacterium]
SLATVQGFINSHPTLPPVRTLTSRFINELAQRQSWNELLQFSPQPPQAMGARCNYYYARVMTGQAAEAWKGADEIWRNGKSLPDSCDKLFDAWRSAGKMTEQAILARAELAFAEGNTGLINYLLKQLPAHDKTLVKSLTALYSKPAEVEKFARSTGPTPFSRNISIIAFQQLARQNSDKAYAALHNVARAQRMDHEQRLQLEESVALQWMNNTVTSQQAQWRDRVVERSHHEALVERRLRMAIGSGERTGLAKWLERLPVEARDKDEWIYWRAVVLLEKGERHAGEKMLHTLMQRRGFYPMAAAQKLNLPYPLKISKATRPDAQLRQSAELARVRELMYWRMDNLALSEWRNLVSHSSPPQQEALARYAFEQNWADLSVQATITAKLWDHLEERFPLAWREEFRTQTSTKGLPVAYAMAIARQESAWNPKAQSSAGAMGLMQLMPKTATSIAKMYGLDDYTHVSQLTNPETNIKVGTTYLGHVYHLFDQNRIFAAIAYNAGPSRVNRWLDNSAGRVDAIAFIESIPFLETRNYVKNVLAYDLFYRYFMQQPLQLLTDTEWGRRY